MLKVKMIYSYNIVNFEERVDKFIKEYGYEDIRYSTTVVDTDEEAVEYSAMIVYKL